MATKLHPSSPYSTEYNDEHKRKTEPVSEAYDRLHREIQNSLPEGRNRSLALTKLEESFHWAQQSIRNAGGNDGFEDGGMSRH